MAVDVKKIALKLAEENAKVVITEIVKPMLEQYIIETENKYDDLLLGFMAQLEKGLLDMAEKISE
jgi:hypothetical protein